MRVSGLGLKVKGFFVQVFRVWDLRFRLVFPWFLGGVEGFGTLGDF